MNTQEIECRFLEIDKDSLIRKALSLGATDKGEFMLEETIMYDKELTWKEIPKFVRLRKSGNDITVSYKEHNSHTVDGMYEIEFGITDFKKAELMFEKIGLHAYRHQQKKRHTFKLNGVTVDIDTWPKIPTYVELEGNSEIDLKETAEALGLDWKDALFKNAAWVIENKYHIPVTEMTWFTFDRFE